MVRAIFIMFFAAPLLAACVVGAVVGATGAVIGATVGATGAVIGATVDAGGAVIDAVTPGDDDKKDDDNR